MKYILIIAVFFLSVLCVFSDNVTDKKVLSEMQGITDNLQKKTIINQLSYKEITENPKWKTVYENLDKYVDLEINKAEVFYTWFEHHPSARWSAGDYRHYYGILYSKEKPEYGKPIKEFIAYTLDNEGYCSYFGKGGENAVWFTEDGQTMLDAYVDDDFKLVLSKDSKGVYVDKIISPNRNFSFYLRYTFPIKEINKVIDAEFKNNNVIKITYENFGYEYWMIVKKSANRGETVNKDDRLIYTAGNPHNFSDKEMEEYIKSFGSNVYMNLGKSYSSKKKDWDLIQLGHEPKKFELLKYEINKK